MEGRSGVVRKRWSHSVKMAKEMGKVKDGEKEKEKKSWGRGRSKSKVSKAGSKEGSLREESQSGDLEGARTRTATV
jgi:hypothetical protein